MKETLAEIDAPHFNCGVVLWDDKVIETAPIVRYMKGWSRDRVRDYCQRNGWKVSVVTELERKHARTRTRLLARGMETPAARIAATLVA